MIRPIALSLGLAAFTLASPHPAVAADATTTYDTVDAFEIQSAHFLVTGILQGQSTPTTRSFFVGTGNDARASLCQRFAMLVMSKPGKFRFAATDRGASTADCKLTVRAP